MILFRFSSLFLVRNKQASHKILPFVWVSFVFLGFSILPLSAQKDSLSPKIDSIPIVINKKGGGGVLKDALPIDSLAPKEGGKKGGGLSGRGNLSDSTRLWVAKDSLKKDTITHNKITIPPTLFTIRKWEKVAYLYTIRQFPPVVSKILTPLDTNRQDPDVAYMRSLIIPGWGQAYNRAYWKIPIVYAGLAGIGYWIYFNNKQYKEFQSAYYFEIDNDTTTSKLQVNVKFAKYPTEGLRTKRNEYRTTRDQGIMLFALAYSLQIIEAYVNAHLKYFDVSEKMAIHVQPTYIPSIAANSHSLGAGKAGIGLTLRF